MLDGVLADRIRFTPDRDQRRYTLNLPIAFDRLMIAALPELGTGLQETVASPTGFEQECIAFLGEILNRRQSLSSATLC